MDITTMANLEPREFFLFITCKKKMILKSISDFKSRFYF